MIGATSSTSVRLLGLARGGGSGSGSRAESASGRGVETASGSASIGSSDGSKTADPSGLSSAYASAMQGLMQDVALSIPHLFQRAERLFPEKQVVTSGPDGRDRVTYGEWAERTRRLGGV